MGMWAGFGEEWSNIHARRVKAMNDQAEKRHTWANSYGKKALDDLKGLSSEYEGYLGILDDYNFSEKAQSGLLETGGLSKLKKIAKKLQKSDHLRPDEIQALVKEAESWSTEEDGSINSMSLVDKINRALNLYKPANEKGTGIDRQSNMIAAILGYDTKSEYSDVDVGGYSYEDLRTLAVSEVDYGGTGARKFTNFRDAPPKEVSQRGIKETVITEVIPQRIDRQINYFNSLIDVEEGKGDLRDDQLILNYGTYTEELQRIKALPNPVEIMQKYNAMFPEDMHYFQKLQEIDQGFAGGGILNNVYIGNIGRFLKNSQDLIKNNGRSFVSVEDYNEAKAAGNLSAGPVMIAGRIAYHGG